MPVKTMKPERLADPPLLKRGPLARSLANGASSPIDRTGGDAGAGIIRGFAVITRGEALGHGVWIDSEFLRQAVAAMNAAPDGVRARFTHPGMSADGLGRKLGRAKNARMDGDIVRADLHFSKSSHTTPEGDLAKHTMDLAEDDADLFGASIVYEYDEAAERAFRQANLTDGGFRSPDLLNVKNLPHARLSSLRATDIVDEPAANPAGLFAATSIPAEADALLTYALGLTVERPSLSAALPIDPDRLRNWAAGFLKRRGLSVQSVTLTDERRQARARQMGQFTQRFGTVAGKAYFALGWSIERAATLHGTPLAERLLEHDPAAELDGAKAAGIFHLSAAHWPQYAPTADRLTCTGHYWKVKTLANWIAAECPGRNGKPAPERLAAFGGVTPDSQFSDLECQVGSRRLAAVMCGTMPPER